MFQMKCKYKRYCEQRHQDVHRQQGFGQLTRPAKHIGGVVHPGLEPDREDVQQDACLQHEKD
jgi:hypothetical protein